MKLLRNGCEVDKCIMCRLCLKEWLPAVKSHRQNYRINKGELLFRENDVLNGIYFVHSGLFKVHKHWDDDKELIVRFAREGDILGHRGLGKDNFFPVSATAIENAVVCFIELDFFIATLKVNNEFLFQLMMFYASELKESERNMRDLAHMPVKGRLARALLTLFEKFGNRTDGSIDISLSRQDLASYVGTSYETVFRMLNEMIAENAVRTEEKKIIITDNEKLLSYTRSN